jgi:transcriptional regulator GlxA family with amidase domain
VDPSVAIELSPDPRNAGGAEIEELLLFAVANALAVSRPHGPCGLCDWQLKRVRAYVHRRLAGPIVVRELAALAKLSPGHFSRAFAVSTGVTPHSYIIGERVRRAVTLLGTQESLAEIAFQCGFSDQSHFSRRFRREFGTPPSRWRRQAQLDA